MIKLTDTKLILTAALAVCAGCAAHQPTDEIAAARQAIQSALNSGTEPSTSPSIATAQQKLSEAEDAMDSGSYREARRLSEQAAVDAEYAQVQSQAIRSSEGLKETMRTHKLHQEVQ